MSGENGLSTLESAEGVGGGICQYIAEPLRGLAVPIDGLNLDPANVRTHGEKNIQAIAASLARWGQRSPIVVQKQGMVVRAGNGRVVAARSLGWKHIAALIVDESSVEATAFAIADNRTAELAEWDNEGLAALLQSMDSDDRMDAGFDDSDLDVLIAELTTPNFEPVSIDEQGRLDQKSPTECPECGHIWTP